MKKIGLLSDTHGFLENRLFDYFKEADEIWHAGDIGESAILERLEELRKVRAVYGNIDGGNLRAALHEYLEFEIEGLRVLMIHIANKPPRYNPKTLSLIRASRPDLLVCGHSHILKVEFDKKNNLLFMNPGAAGNHGFHKVKTALRFSIDQGKAKNLEVIDLGKRGSLKGPTENYPNL